MPLESKTSSCGLVAAAIKAKPGIAMPASTTNVTGKRKRNDVEIIDLCDDDDDTQVIAKAPGSTKKALNNNAPATPQRKKPRPELAQSASAQFPELQASIAHIDAAAAASQPVELQQASPEDSLPTPETTPQKKELYELPQRAERYLTKTATVEGIEYTNPFKFTLNPAFWRRWSIKDYMDFGEQLRYQFDPIPFARASGKPVEEVQHMATALIINPLYAAIEAKRRGEEGMFEILALHKSSTPMRPWGVSKKEGTCKVIAELSGVATGSVQVITKGGSKAQLSVKELSKVDHKYLEDTLTPENKAVLFNVEKATGVEQLDLAKMEL